MVNMHAQATGAQWDLVLEKVSQRRLNEEGAREQLAYIKNKAVRNKKLGFSVRQSKFPLPAELENGEFLYKITLRFTRHHHLSKADQSEPFEQVCASVFRAANTKGWRLVGELDEYGAAVENPLIEQLNKNYAAPVDTEVPVKVPRKPLMVPPLDSSVFKDHFHGIFERASQIRLIHDTIETFNKTKKEKRGHTLLFGPPATAKTSIFLAYKDWLEGFSIRPNSFLMLDATTLTKAGLERELLDRAERDELPDILVCEEIEKHQPDNLLSLLSVMDNRATINRLNARIGNRQEQCKLLVFATCNDIDKLRDLHKGALLSRFVHQYHCPAPSAALIKNILHREVLAMGGDAAWVAAAIDIANTVGIKDIRAIIGLLDGRDRLVTGEYKTDIMAVFKSIE